MSLNLLVLRCFDLEASAVFYSLFGFSFRQEQHGSGPLHYTAIKDDLVFELYPMSKTSYPDDCRLGFTVKNLASLIPKLKMKSALYKDLFIRDGHKMCIAKDPDGRKIEVQEYPVT